MTAQAQLATLESHSASAIGLRTAVRIMEGWKATQDQMCKILRVSRSSINRAKAGRLDSIALDDDQLDRVSFVLNIHAALRTIFDNPENVQGFVNMKNDNPFFNGRAPLEVMADGGFINLYETARRIDALRGAGW
ncbi:MAG: antitoxin Xre-like helix-turn-helix domain-containing protein [Pseudomonas sp.]